MPSRTFPAQPLRGAAAHDQIAHARRATADAEQNPIPAAIQAQLHPEDAGRTAEMPSTGRYAIELAQWADHLRLSCATPGRTRIYAAAIGLDEDQVLPALESTISGYCRLAADLARTYSALHRNLGRARRHGLWGAQFAASGSRLVEECSSERHALWEASAEFRRSTRVHLPELLDLMLTLDAHALMDPGEGQPHEGI